MHAGAADVGLSAQWVYVRFSAVWVWMKMWVCLWLSEYGYACVLGERNYAGGRGCGPHFSAFSAFFFAFSGQVP